ncbi:hypothetical protein BH09ACT10_BH09ACT10_31430 [soil metagenome]
MRATLIALFMTMCAMPILGAGPASALSCVVWEDMPQDSAISFVGTVTDQRDDHVELDVDRVVRGPDLAPSVWIALQAEQGEDRMIDGETYVVSANGSLATNACQVVEASEIATPAGRKPVAGGLAGQEPKKSDVPGKVIAFGLLAAVALILPIRRVLRR